jgi:hypothetical protein
MLDHVKSMGIKLLHRCTKEHSKNWTQLSHSSLLLPKKYEYVAEKNITRDYFKRSLGGWQLQPN